MTQNENTMLEYLIKSIIDVVNRHKDGMKLKGFFWEITSGLQKVQMLIAFKPEGYDQIEIKVASFLTSAILDELRKAGLLGSEAYSKNSFFSSTDNAE